MTVPMNPRASSMASNNSRKQLTIWVTGASSGIGRALALQLAKQGHTVIVSARRMEALQQLRAQAPDAIIPLALDLAERASMQRAAKVLADYEYLDWVIANAGTCEYVDVAEFNADVVRRVCTTNIFGTANTVELALPLLREAIKRGRTPILAAVSSSSSWFPFPRAEAYGASKAAIDYLMRSLRADLAAEAIAVSIISPGFVKTPLTDVNDFAMPGLIDSDAAAEAIIQGLRRRRLSIHFPKRFTWSLKLLSWLPERSILAIGRKLSRSSSDVDASEG